MVEHQPAALLGAVADRERTAGLQWGTREGREEMVNTGNIKMTGQKMQMRGNIKTKWNMVRKKIYVKPALP